MQPLVEAVPGEPLVVRAVDTVRRAGEDAAPPQPPARERERKDRRPGMADALRHPELLPTPHWPVDQRPDPTEEAVPRALLIAAIVVRKGKGHPPRAGELFDDRPP